MTTPALSGPARRAAAENLLVAFHARSAAPEGTQGHVMAAHRFAALCKVGARAGLATSPGELEVIVADVADQIPPTPHGLVGIIDRTWLMQARFLLARRFRQMPRDRAAA